MWRVKVSTHYNMHTKSKLTIRNVYWKTQFNPSAKVQQLFCTFFIKWTNNIMYVSIINISRVFKTASAFYLGSAKEGVKSRFPISNVSASNITLIKRALPRLMTTNALGQRLSVNQEKRIPLTLNNPRQHRHIAKENREVQADTDIP